MFSPVQGSVEMVFDTLHAVTLTAEDGTEILIHVGLDTVKLNGKHYKACVKNRDSVKVGDLLLEFDPDAIKAESYDMITPVIISNSGDFGDILTVTGQDVHPGDSIIKAIR